MWKPLLGLLGELDFITLHYTWIIFSSILGLIIIYPYGNMPAIDAYFFGASASTESGLNTIGVKDLKTYQQLYIYFAPIFTNLGFINIIVVAVRLHWFKKKFKAVAPAMVRPEPQGVVFSLRRDDDVEAAHPRTREPEPELEPESKSEPDAAARKGDGEPKQAGVDGEEVYYIPGPQERDRGKPFEARDAHQGRKHAEEEDNDDIAPVPEKTANSSDGLKQRKWASLQGPGMSAARSIENAANSLFVLGGHPSTTIEKRASNASHPHVPPRPPNELPTLSKQVTIGRNSRFLNLSRADREKLGGIEYRALKVLLKIVAGYFFGLHLLGAVCLVGWIHRAPAKYTDWLAENGQDRTWWAVYSAQTMVDNLGFTLTPDSMITFADATWPLLVMTFLAFAGNTLYPVVLRLCIWLAWRLVPSQSSTRDSLRFLLDHPRRCYTLLFPSRPTWILLGIIFALNLVDVVLIITLDLDNPAVTSLPLGPRVLAAIFQAASARHTGTATFNLASVSPAVQFSLLVMMYIAILPIAIAIRASNTYEERALGVYEGAAANQQNVVDESNAASYVRTHVQNQLSFDLWYIFLGTFCICCAEADRIVDLEQPAFSVFSVFFEVVSGYGNVGLSLGHPDVSTSLCGQFTLFSKLVICAMMIRGRHRGLPYSLDRAIMLPNERDALEDSQRDEQQQQQQQRTLPMASSVSRSTNVSIQEGKTKPS